MESRILRRHDGAALPLGYFINRTADRRKLDRIVAHLAHACAIESVRIVTDASGKQGYCVEGDRRWLQGIDVIDALARRLAESRNLGDN